MSYKSVVITLFRFLTAGLRGQNFTVSASQSPKCFGECNGSITFSTASVTGPFTASLTNNGSCPNSTVQNSTANSITINSICACPGSYTATIYNPSLAVVGTMVFQFLNYAVAPLVINTTSITPATCTNCCDGAVYFSVSGGNTNGTPTYSFDGTYTTNVNPLYFLCVGDHTVCVEDPSGCVACVSLHMPYNGEPLGLNEKNHHNGINIYPNPALNELFIESAAGSVRRAEIIDICGRKAFTFDIPADEKKTELRINGLGAGLYHLLIYDSAGQLIFSNKLAKKD